MDGGERDAALIRGIGPVALAAAIVNGVVGAGIFTLPAAMARAAGDAAPLAYLIVALAMAGVVACFAEAGSRMPTSGGAAGYIAAAFGPGPGFVASLLTWLSSVLAAGGIASALAGSMREFSPALGGTLARDVIVVTVIGGITALHLSGVHGASRVVAIGTAVKLVPLLLFAAIGAGLAWHAAPIAGAATPGHDLGRGLILAVFAFSGMETPLSASGEVARPNRSVPIAIFASMIFVLFLYLTVQLVAQLLLGAELARSAAPLADAAGRIGGAAHGAMLGAASLSMLIWIGTDILGAPRLLFGAARDGILPAWLGQVNRAHVPARAILLHATIAAALALSGGFVQLAVLSTLAGAALYILACGAAWRLHAQDVAVAGRPFSIRALPAFAALGIGSMGLVILLARPIEIAGLLLSVSVAVAMYRMRGPHKPSAAVAPHA